MDYFRLLLVLLLISFSLFVAMKDMASRVVSNKSIIVIFILCFGVNLTYSSSADIVNFTIFYTMLLIGTVTIYSLKVIGGGDIKLLMAYAFALPPSEATFALLLTAIFGGILALLYLVLYLVGLLRDRYFGNRNRNVPRLPYAVAICSGFCFSIAKYAASGELL